jgi:hypothetical protein
VARVDDVARPYLAVLSVMSDYVSTGRDSFWHGLDRWMSSMMTVFMIYYAHSALSPLHCLMVGRCML